MSGPPEPVLALVDEDLAYADRCDEAMRSPEHAFTDLMGLITGSLAARHSADTTHQIIFGTHLDEDAWRVERGLPQRVSLR